MSVERYKRNAQILFLSPYIFMSYSDAVVVAALFVRPTFANFFSFRSPSATFPSL